MRGVLVLSGVVVLLFGCGSPMAGQGWAVGVRTGLSASTVSSSETPIGDRLGPLERRTTWTAAFVLERDLGDGWGLRLEAARLGKGFTEVEDGERVEAEIDYAEVPLLVRWAPPIGSGRVVPELYAGPWVAFETGCDVGFSIGGEDGTFDCDEIPDDPVLRETVDWGATGGAALRIGLSSAVDAVVDARYAVGLRNVDASPEVENFELHNRYFAVTAGLTWHLGG